MEDASLFYCYQGKTLDESQFGFYTDCFLYLGGREHIYLSRSLEISRSDTCLECGINQQDYILVPHGDYQFYLGGVFETFQKGRAQDQKFRLVKEKSPQTFR